jgi:hypothetical protein
MAARFRGFQHLRLDALELDSEGCFDRTTCIPIIRRSLFLSEICIHISDNSMGMLGLRIDLRGVSRAACTRHNSPNCTIIQANRNYEYRFA